MGAGSSRKKNSSSKQKSVCLTNPTPDRRNVKDEPKKRKKSTSGKEEKGGQFKLSSQTTPSTAIVYSRSKSMPAEKPMGLNKSLSTSLRFSDFCKIVRSERVESSEFKPVDVPYKTTQKVTEDSLCHICSVYTGSETYACSVCYHIYHESCLVKVGQCQNDNMKYVHASASSSGWSCHLCNNVSNLLTNGEMTLLLGVFGRCKVQAGQDLTSEQYLSYRKLYYVDQLGVEMTSKQLTEEFELFEKLVNRETSRLMWTLFFNLESLKVLERRNKNALVRKLTEPEIQTARQLVALRDMTDEGEVSLNALQRLTSQFGQIFHLTRKDNSFFDSDLPETLVSWEDFLRQMAIYLIASRLNVFRQAVAEAKQCADAEVTALTSRSTSSVTITSQQPVRKGTTRSVYVINSTYGRLLVDNNKKGSKRPMSLA